jgi:iron complex outermembrane receptor protein
MKHIAILFSLIVLMTTAGLAAAEFSGRVVNKDGDPIEGVNILTDVLPVLSVTDRDGRFALRVPEESPKYLTFSHVSYRPEMLRVTGEKMTDIRIVMDYAILPGQKIRVTAMRAENRLTPVAFSDFTEEEIERDYRISDFPILLETTPNMYAFSYTGGSVGASDYKIRGFDSKRIGVYINGIPLNDPEDQSTYFYDIPDFASEVADIQIQRGVGNSLYGDATFGGSINIASAGLERKRRIAITSGYGRYYADDKFVSEMRKQSFEYSSGLIDGRWSLAGRYSKMYSGGYREYSWYDGWAYYLSLSRLDPNMTTTLNLYGGPIKAHLAFYGVDRETMKENRRLNWSSYENEIDDFNQPHYELHNVYRLSEDLALKNTLYYIRGKGYYEGYKGGKGYFEYNIPDAAIIDTTIDEIDLVRQKWVTKNQYGWNPRLDLSHENGAATLGGAFYYFDSEHWGEIVWAENVTINPRYRYYEYFGKKYSAAVYAVESYSLTDKIRLTGNLQLRYLKYDFDQTRMGVYQGYTYDLDWLFFAPRLGITYLFNDQTDGYFSFAVSSREPDDATIYDADYPYSKPAVDNNGELIADAERVYDFELGGHWRGEKHRLGLNLFWMEFRNEIVLSVGIDEDGRPLLGNAERSVHSGIEMEGRYHAHKYITVSGNAAYNYNRLEDYIQYSDTDWDGTIDDTADFSGNPIAGFPEYIGNLILDSKIDPIRLVYRLRIAGRQYIENGKDKDMAIDPYTVSYLTADFSLGELARYGRFTISATINNLLNEKYELAGVVDEGWGYYFPAAERNFFVQLKWELE